ncbi:hypothetical protein J4558_13310 [Leptolyngbya sp. 15MV]|nr:hypothetical protein J4558_13310 [Leptolyngbya sp. 15MV]
MPLALDELGIDGPIFVVAARPGPRMVNHDVVEALGPNLEGHALDA